MQFVLRLLLFLIGATSVALYIYKGLSQGDFDAWQQALAGLAALISSLPGGSRETAGQARSSQSGPSNQAPAPNRALMTFGRTFILLGVLLMLFDAGTGFLLVFLGIVGLILELVVRQVAVAGSSGPWSSRSGDNGSLAVGLMLSGVVLTCTGYGAIIGIPLGLYGLWLFAQGATVSRSGIGHSVSGVYLEIVNPGRATKLAGHKLPLKDITTIGRTEAADITIPDGLVSKWHAQLRWDGREWLIEDLGSTNGTCLAGYPVVQPTPVRFGELIQFGGRVYARLAR